MDAAEEAFHNHAEMMMQTARFVAASSPQPKSKTRFIIQDVALLFLCHKALKPTVCIA